MKYRTNFGEYNAEEDILNDELLELNEKIPDLEIGADISLYHFDPDLDLNQDYRVYDKFYSLVREEDNDDWVFSTSYCVMVHTEYDRYMKVKVVNFPK